MSVIPRETRGFNPSILDRSFDLTRINIEVVAYIGLVLLSIIAHLWNLGVMAMHHDESIHAWMSWRFYAGVGGFTCAGGRTAATYCYDPVYHGPLLYTLTLISYFLFGDGEAQARLPQALCGVLLVASCWELRPYFGKRGAFLAGVLLAFTPALLYYTRFARHDGLMVLFEFWLALGLFRYVDTAKPRYLYFAAASVALAVATHELYYILFFLFGAFLLIRLLDEYLPRRPLLIGLGVALAVSAVVVFLQPQVTPTLNIGGLATVFLAVLGGGTLALRVWDNRPFVSDRFAALWRTDRRTLWTALGIMATLYVLLYSTFFADPRGILDGLYRGLQYWLGSQHEYARGDQPWYYYFMLLPIYEPLALFGGLAAVVFLFIRGVGPRHAPVQRLRVRPAPRVVAADEAAVLDGEAVVLDNEASVQDQHIDSVPVPAVAAEPWPAVPMAALFPLFLAYWFIGALVAFSWAGEKMPWLLVHISLPGNLLVAWMLGHMLRSVNWRALNARRAALVPVAALLLFVALGVALWRIGSGSSGQEAQSNLAQGLVPLLIGGGLIYGLLTLAQGLGRRATLILAALTVVGLFGAYTLRSSWLVVYRHPDTPVEPLIYTQSSPDVPLIARDVRNLSINQTRNQRSSTDPIGGLTMPVIMDSGGTDGEGSLAWPYQWYFRDFQRIENRNADFFSKATADSFQVPVDSSQPNGEKELAPVVLVYTPHVVEATKQALEANYVKRYDSKLNWWFPEGNRCDPQGAGYKRFYFNDDIVDKARTACNNTALQASQFSSVLAPFLWPFDRANWPDLRRYLLYRELPAPLTLNGREMQVWVRSDLVGGGGSSTTTSASSVVKLVSQQSYGAGGEGNAALNAPRGVAVDAKGDVYVTDTGNNTIQIYSADGKMVRTIGGLGSGEGQFNEPRGVAVDTQGNIYVADTWNARIVKLDPNGAFLKTWGTGSQDLGSGRKATILSEAAQLEAQPLGFFGPRGVAVDTKGRVYIVDTGNKRIVVTDNEGNFLYQWGHAGSEAGAFNEPVGIALDQAGNAYVADSWNSRVQVFSPAGNDQVSPVPAITWNISGWQPNTYDDPSLTVSPGGQVFASVPSRNEMLYANMRGDVLLRWGGAGTDTASLNLPSGGAVGPDGNVYIVDRGNNRVLRFALPQIEPAQPAAGG